jgi:hypothetical protein
MNSFSQAEKGTSTKIVIKNPKKRLIANKKRLIGILAKKENYLSYFLDELYIMMTIR